MFGLMRARCCSLTDEQRTNRRMHYCGTCKTMGSLYGQRSRVLLNFDAVFLAELLTALSTGPGGSAEWSGAYRSYNCFSLPKTAEEMPPGMQVAAAATIVLAEFKLLDQITDSRKLKWRFAHRFFSRSFRRASATLRDQ